MIRRHPRSVDSPPAFRGDRATYFSVNVRM
jgi:hypothetical protein